MIFDGAGRVSQMQSNGATIFSDARYRPFGPASGWTWGNGASYSREFDQNGRVSSFPVGSGTYTLAYDSAGRLVSMAGSTYGYDASGRLTQAPGNSYTYDLNGNRLTLGSGKTTTYTYDSASNRLLSMAGGTRRTYTYDAAGNVLTDGTGTYTYDGRGRMATAIDWRLLQRRYVGRNWIRHGDRFHSGIGLGG